MVQAQQDFAQPIGPTPEKVLFDALPINEDPDNYVLTHAAIAVANSGLYECTYTVNAGLGSGIGGNLTAYVVLNDGSGAESMIRESVSFEDVSSSSPKATLNNTFQIALPAGCALKVFAGFVGTGDVNTLPFCSILALKQF
jgi:hypothetical protein